MCGIGVVSYVYHSKLKVNVGKEGEYRGKGVTVYTGMGMIAAWG